MAEPVTVRDEAEHAAQSVENELGKPKERDLSSAIDEIKAARGNPEFMEAFNAKLADNETAVPMLSGFKLIGLDAENEMVFEDEKHHRYELDAQGNRVDVWGDPGHDREFVINPDGSATHEVKKGDHIWGITKDMLREKLGREPNNQEVADAVKVVVEYNQNKGNITDPNHIEPRNHIDVPPEYVKDVKHQRGEGWAANSEDGRTTEVTVPDGRTRSIERDENGKVSKVTEKDASGAPVSQWTRNDDGTWTVTNKDGTVVRKMNAEVEADQEGNIKITHKNGNVEEFRANGQHVVTTKEGDLYEERADGWYKRGKDQQEFAKVEGGIKIEEDGQIKEGADTTPPPPPAPPSPESAEAEGGAAQQQATMSNTELAAYPESDNFAAVLKRHFDEISNLKGDAKYVTKAEIDEYLEKHPEIQGNERAALQAAAAKMDCMEEFHNDELGDESCGMTKDDIDDYQTAEREHAQDMAMFDYIETHRQEIGDMDDPSNLRNYIAEQRKHNLSAADKLALDGLERWIGGFGLNYGKLGHKPDRDAERADNVRRYKYNRGES